MPGLRWLNIAAETYLQVMQVIKLCDLNRSMLNRQVRIYRKYNYKVAGAIETTYERSTKLNDVILPELSIVAAWVILMKLAYGLDDHERGVYLENDPSLAMPPGEAWLAKLREGNANGTFKSGRQSLATQDFAAMDLVGMDRFLDEAESILLKDHTFEQATGQLWSA